MSNGSNGHENTFTSEDAEQAERIKRIEAVVPDIAAALLYQTNLLQRQNEHIARERRELSEQLHTLRASLDQHAVAQGALKCIRSVVAQLDSDTPMTSGYKRPASPLQDDPQASLQPPKKARKRPSTGVPHTPSLQSPHVARPGLVEYQSPYPIQPRTNGSSTPLDVFISEAQNAQSVDPNLVPEFGLSRAVRTVRELWEEYTVGINGQRSVQSMDEEWGPRWRRSSKEAVFYCLRKVIYEEIKRLRDEVYNGSVELAVAALDKRMADNSMPSLNKLGNVLKAEKLERTGQRATLEPADIKMSDETQEGSWPPTTQLEDSSFMGTVEPVNGHGDEARQVERILQV